MVAETESGWSSRILQLITYLPDCSRGESQIMVACWGWRPLQAAGPPSACQVPNFVGGRLEFNGCNLLAIRTNHGAGVIINYHIPR
jgi:hypothetical protein